jgi:hypothetical protein
VQHNGATPSIAIAVAIAASIHIINTVGLATKGLAKIAVVNNYTTAMTATNASACIKVPRCSIMAMKKDTSLMGSLPSRLGVWQSGSWNWCLIAEALGHSNHW